MLWILTGLAAQAGGLDLGVGLQNNTADDRALESGRLIVRWDAGIWAAEGAVAAAMDAEQVRTLDEVLVHLISIQDPGYSRTVGVDQVGLSGVLTHRFVPPAERLCGPALHLGGEYTRQQMISIQQDGDDTRNFAAGSRMVPAAVAGVGLEASRGRLSGRVALLDRVRLIDGGLHHEPTFTFDVLWRL